MDLVWPCILARLKWQPCYRIPGQWSGLKSLPERHFDLHVSGSVFRCVHFVVAVVVVVNVIAQAFFIEVCYFVTLFSFVVLRAIQCIHCWTLACFGCLKQLVH